MKTLGIITTTYNRAYCIEQVYKSLIKQGNKDFKWLVVDDGSTDETKDVIARYINEGLIDIEYIYQENKGMTGARNTGYRHIDTEINTIIDSDDWLEVDAVDKIIKFWNEHKASDIAGIIALNRRTDGDKSAANLPQNVYSCTYAELFDQYKCKGDKKLIYRSELTKNFEYPKFEDEKIFPASYKFRMLDQKYKMLLMAEEVCVVDVNEGSMSFNLFNQYKTNPQGFSFYRNEMMKCSKDPKFKFKQAIHYVSSSIFAKNKSFLCDANEKLYVIMAIPLGIFLFIYLNLTKRKSLRSKPGEKLT